MNETYIVPVIRITEGLKVFAQNEESCYELEKKLNSLGIKTRVGHNIEADLWSIYIISIPENKIGTYQTI